MVVCCRGVRPRAIARRNSSQRPVTKPVIAEAAHQALQCCRHIPSLSRANKARVEHPQSMEGDHREGLGRATRPLSMQLAEPSVEDH